MSKKKSRNKNLIEKTKKIKGRIKVLRALPYFDCQIYIRRININGKRTLFEYLVPIKGEIYASYMEFTHKKKLTDNEEAQATALILAGAMTTIEKVLKIKPKKETKITEKFAKEFIKNYEKTRKLVN